ncbi:helix-turn-helix domain-containing protein [Porphyromonas sp.]|uniref:AraC family transcriptional regulator n=1 Tax=Porphyromonas sp. TaxID=1924944 RepID=UPI0026DD2941|nr:helix-turn-helix domain-containing protein [Porphyromonas sp.]MDO4695639.1 helix-turn-helix domain-containing protein [Porphyromonas sp.]MDO4771535.1 helix-turn-helix domain-containing protein [Porphyromonas sp.]
MNYQTFQPHPDLQDFVKCYWILEVPAEPSPQKQRAIVDGYIEMIFHLADDVRSYSDEVGYSLQPRAMILGHPVKPFFFEPTGVVDTFAVRFLPYGFSNLIKRPLRDLTDKVLPLRDVFDEAFSGEVIQQINQAETTQERIAVIEHLLIEKINTQETIDHVIKNTISALVQANGNRSIHTLLEDCGTNRRQLERKFTQQVGLSPKQLSRVIRLQTALRILLNHPTDKLCRIAYEADYYDQAHFIREFKEFVGTTPRSFGQDASMEVASLMYSEE